VNNTSLFGCTNHCKALQAIYPGYVPKAKPQGYWKYKENQKKFFDQLATKWNIQKEDDWNRVTLAMVTKEGGYFLADYYNNSLQRGTVFKEILLTSISITSDLS
jgi:hypothetical protein